MRGPNLELLWVDELASWARLDSSTDDPWEMCKLMTRVGRAQIIVTTTPRPLPIIEEMLGGSIVVSDGGTTFDNASNLSSVFLADVRRLVGDAPGGDRSSAGRS